MSGKKASGVREPSGSAMTSPVATREELEQMGTKELHDRAVKHARRHANVKFLWNLMKATSSAEAVAGEFDEVHDDAQSIFGHMDDLRRRTEGEVGELLRPMYIEYILEHNA